MSFSGLCDAAKVLLRRNFRLVKKPLPPDRIPSHVPADFEVDDPMDPTRDMNGIIARLTERCHGNVHDSGIVTITSRSENSEKCGTETRCPEGHCGVQTYVAGDWSDHSS